MTRMGVKCEVFVNDKNHMKAVVSNALAQSYGRLRANIVWCNLVNCLEECRTQGIQTCYVLNVIWHSMVWKSQHRSPCPR